MSNQYSYNINVFDPKVVCNNPDDPWSANNALPDLLQTALGVAFDTNVGHDYVENAEQRFEFYHTEEIHTVQ